MGHLLNLNPRSSTGGYFLHPPTAQLQGALGGAAGSAGGDDAGRYPRRSSRGRNHKRDDLYVPLDSDDEQEGGGVREGGGAREERRGPGRPRKPGAGGAAGGGPMLWQNQAAATPPTARMLGPNPVSEILSPFAQFLLDHHPEGGGQAAGGAAPGGPGSDAVDYAALDDFISSLNFSNDELLGGPEQAAPAPTAIPPPPAAPAAAAAPTPPQADYAGAAAATAKVAAVPAGMPAGTVPVAALQPALRLDPGALPAEPSSPVVVRKDERPHPALSPGILLDPAACRPLETPTLAGLLAGGHDRKTPGASPPLGALMSPTLLGLHF